MVLRDAESEQVGKLIGQMHTISTFDVNDQDQDQEVYEMMRPNQANSMVYKQQCQCKNKEFTSGKIQQKKKKKTCTWFYHNCIYAPISTLCLSLCVTRTSQKQHKTIASTDCRQSKITTRENSSSSKSSRQCEAWLCPVWRIHHSTPIQFLKITNLNKRWIAQLITPPIIHNKAKCQINNMQITRSN